MKYKGLYDELYSNGWVPWPVTPSAELIREVKKRFRWNNSVLDVGCGDGDHVYSLNEAGYDAHGIDISDVPINFCRMMGLIKCKVNSCSNMYFKDNTFNIVISSDLLEHVDKEELELFAKELYRVMKGDGSMFCFRIGLRKSKRVWKRFQMIIDEWGLEDLHLTLETPSFWKDLFKRHGFYRIETDVEERSKEMLPSPPPIGALKRLTGGAATLLKQDIKNYEQEKKDMYEKSEFLMIKGFKK